MKEYDVIIIGSGPAGYVAAIRAGQLGLTTAIVEKDKIGGMCLNWGCIPSKAMIESAKLYARMLKSASFGIDGLDKNALSFNWKKAIARKDRIVTRLVKGVEYLLKRNGVDTITGVASIAGSNTVVVGDDKYETRNILVATGSRPDKSTLPNAGDIPTVELDAFYSAEDLPDSFVVYDGSAMACETAYTLRAIGKKVTIVSQSETLVGYLDDSLSKFIVDKFSKSGIELMFNSSITKAGEGGVFIGDDFVECNQIINCCDRVPVLPEISGVSVDLEGGCIKVNEFMQTSASGIYAVGDVTGQFTAHAGSAQGNCAVNHMAGIKSPIDYSKIPMNIYTDPEIASVGVTEGYLKERGIEYRSGDFPLSVNGKAMTEGTAEGFVKVLAEARYGEVVGVHIAAAHATDMIAEAVSIMNLEGTLESVGSVVHAHPTLSETVLEAGFKAADKPLHI
jgi:dihydrolipoamide dehydrogenase